MSLSSWPCRCSWCGKWFLRAMSLGFHECEQEPAHTLQGWTLSFRPPSIGCPVADHHDWLDVNDEGSTFYCCACGASWPRPPDLVHLDWKQDAGLVWALKRLASPWPKGRFKDG